MENKEYFLDSNNQNDKFISDVIVTLEQGGYHKGKQHRIDKFGGVWYGVTSTLDEAFPKVDYEVSFGTGRVSIYARSSFISCNFKSFPVTRFKIEEAFDELRDEFADNNPYGITYQKQNIGGFSSVSPSIVASIDFNDLNISSSKELNVKDFCKLIGKLTDVFMKVYLIAREFDDLQTKIINANDKW